jgi:hypothetical protein
LNNFAKKGDEFYDFVKDGNYEHLDAGKAAKIRSELTLQKAEFNNEVGQTK